MPLHLEYDFQMRYGTLLLAMLLVVFFSLSAAAQANGVPPSVTSFGFGGRSGFNGVPPSVTSVGPRGPGAPHPVHPHPNQPQASGQPGHHHALTTETTAIVTTETTVRFTTCRTTSRTIPRRITTAQLPMKRLRKMCLTRTKAGQQFSIAVAPASAPPMTICPTGQERQFPVRRPRPQLLKMRRRPQLAPPIPPPPLPRA